MAIAVHIESFRAAQLPRPGLMLIIIVALMSHGDAGGFVALEQILVDTTTGLRLYRGKPFTGEARDYFAAGRLARAEQFIAGRRHGSLRMWFQSGSLSFDSQYAAGKRDGTTRSWWDNGNPRSETHFVNDLPEGIARSWYRSGERYKQYRYKAGQSVGLQQAWRKNGELFSNFEYRNGRAYGLQNSKLCVELDDENPALYR